MQNSFYLKILFSNVLANFFFVVLHLKYTSYLFKYLKKALTSFQSKRKIY